MSGNVLTDLQIFNAVLLRLGETKPVTAVDGSDTTKFGVIAGSEYYRTRDEELRAHVWKFAVKRQKLTPAYILGTATWGSGATSLTVASGVTLVTFTANAALVPTSDLQSRTLLSASITPLPSWVGKSISGTGIPAGTVIEGVDSILNTVRLSKKVTASGTGVTFVLSPIKVGWAVTSGLAPGGATPQYPSGIADETFITAVNGNTLTLSKATTAAGTAMSVCFQPINALGSWYIYNSPADALRDTEVYVLLPNCISLWPFRGLISNNYPSRHEGGYIYTNLDPAQGAYGAYIAQVTDPALFDPLFADAFAMRLATKIALYVTGGDKLTDRFAQEYSGLIERARRYNLMEIDIEEEGSPFWTDR
jgi:hypothetical protein